MISVLVISRNNCSYRLCFACIPFETGGMFRNRIRKRYESLREMLNVALAVIIRRVVNPFPYARVRHVSNFGLLRTPVAADLSR